ncbi:hypothetical protein CRG98_028837 [Punica granatum]|uniref:Uncharacterized protein n=1 Tax=Punica granatum TaxID=22663 RepID=A0A2I0J3Z9_PUNGR|nr:hypothetical protein CRG98_028837 [Punica granatum]
MGASANPRGGRGCVPFCALGPTARSNGPSPDLDVQLGHVLESTPSEAPCSPRLSAPHFGPLASYTRIPDQSPGYYSSPGNRRRTCGHGDTNNRRRAGSIRKAEESSRKNLQTKNPENSGVGIVALFITESLKHRKMAPPKWAYRHPGTIKAMGQASDDHSKLYGAPRGTFQW